MKKRFSITIAVAAPILFVAAFLFKDLFVGLAAFFPPCYFYVATGHYCPGCGNTRSVLALLRGDILSSLRNNITPIILITLLILLYIELIFSIMGKNVKILPRKGLFWVIFVGLIFVYYIVRNFVGEMQPIS